jgi:pimeloyl-ACP methyl ester carboxylesterase
MPHFRGPDGTELAYHVRGQGAPLICLPGGPMCASAYLGDLGGLSALRQLVLLDPRGTGQSAVPADPASYRCDRQAGDVGALADHLGLDRIDLLGHSAGGNLAVLFAARYPQRVSRLVLLTPSPFAGGLEVTAAMRREILERRRDEPGGAAAVAAFDQIQAGRGTEDDWAAIVPFTFARWDAAAQAVQAETDKSRNDEAAGMFGGPGAFDPAALRAALAAFPAPVLLVAGELDLNTPPPVATQYAALFPDARLAIQPRGAHSPWLDPDWFIPVMAGFLGGDGPGFTPDAAR